MVGNCWWYWRKANTGVLHCVQDDGEKQATAKTTATAKIEADPCGMTARKASATSRFPKGMTERKTTATARATAKATTGVLHCVQDDGLLGRVA
jgi:hypothetical protein